MTMTGDGPGQSPFVFTPIDTAESELPPRRLLVFAFENDAHAHAALGDVKQLVARGKLKVEDACVVVRREDKMLDITETADMGGLGGAMRGSARVRRSARSRASSSSMAIARCASRSFPRRAGRKIRVPSSRCSASRCAAKHAIR